MSGSASEQGERESYDQQSPGSKAVRDPDQDRLSNEVAINIFRRLREGNFNRRNGEMFATLTLRLESTLPLPALEEDPGRVPWLLSLELPQDFCGKSTTIYSTDMLRNFTRMHNFILVK